MDATDQVAVHSQLDGDEGGLATSWQLAGCCCCRRYWLVLRVRPIPMRVLIVGWSMIYDEEEELGSRCTDVSFSAGRDGSKGIDGVLFCACR